MSEWTADDLRALRIDNISDDERAVVADLLTVWTNRRTANLKRSLYYDGEQAFKDLGLTLPPQLKNAKFSLGWATQAVRAAAMRSRFDGLRLPGSEDPFELGEILAANKFRLELSQGIVSAYKHGMSLATVAKGAAGEAPVQIQTHSAESCAAIWDRRARRVAAALTISDMDADKPTEFIVYLPSVVLRCVKIAGRWVAERIENRIGRTLAVPITYDPQLGKPFGRSRITAPVMSLTDMGVRAYVRMEGNAEFYSSPQLAIEGIDPDAFEGITEQKKFKLAMDRLLALTRDADGNAPTIKQMQQATMTPHSDMIRTVASAFSGETGIPLAELGILHDNPSSAEAMLTAERKLMLEVNNQNDVVLGESVKDIATLAVMVRDGLTEPPADAWRMSAAFADPEFRSTSANADAYVKLAGANEDLKNSPVLLETVFDGDQIARFAEERKTANASSLVRSLVDSARAPLATEVTDGGAVATGGLPASE